MAHCSFGRVIVNDVFKAKYPFRTDLEGRLLFIRDGERAWLLAVFDFSYMFRQTISLWRRQVSLATGIPEAQIWVHVLQNHTAPEGPEMEGPPGENLVELCLPKIQEMMSQAEEAELSYVIANLGEQFNMNREQYIPEFGGVSVWMGCEFDQVGRPYCQDPERMLLWHWKPNPPEFKAPVYFDRPVDPQGALMVFRSVKTRETMGTLLRFAAHPDIMGCAAMADTTSNPEQRWYHFDWPGYTRQLIDSRLGGIALCLCGPCGDLSPRKKLSRGYAEGERECKRIGFGIAEACLAEWSHSSLNWEQIQLAGMSNARIDLPLRKSIPRHREELLTQEEKIKKSKDELQAAMDSHAAPARIRSLHDEYCHQSHLKHIVNIFVNLTDDELRKREMSVEISALRLNDLIIVGLPAETMTGTAQWLRAQSIGNRLITIDQVNGYCAYLVTPEQYAQGGYSYWCSCLAREAEQTLRQRTLALINSVAYDQ